jgi:hypothetical protein
LLFAIAPPPWQQLRLLLHLPRLERRVAAGRQQKDGLRNMLLVTAEGWAEAKMQFFLC